MYGECKNCNKISLVYNLGDISGRQNYKKNTKDGEQDVKTKNTTKSQKVSTVAKLIALFEADICCCTVLIIFR